MKVIPIAVQQELDRSTSRLARAMWIRRRDGQVFGFTTARRAALIDDVFYRPAYSFQPTDISTGSSLDTDDLEIEGLLQTNTITEDDIRAGRWDYAEFKTFRYNWASPSDGIIKDRRGRLGKISVGTGSFTSELLGMMESYNTGIGKITQPGCRTSLGTAECGVTPTVVTGTVATAINFGAFTDSGRTEPDGYFSEGTVTLMFETGPLSYEVKSYTPGAWETKLPVAYDATGVEYTMSEGCTRRFQEDCVERFANGIRFRGEPWLRGNDALAQVGRHS